MAIPAVVAGIAAAAPTIIGGLSALWNNSSQNKNLRWQKWAQGVTWQREDNAIQRRVNDLRMAGLSPVLAAGQAAETSAPVRTEAPQLDISPALQASQLMLSFMKAKEEIATTQAQRKLLEYQAGGTALDNQRKQHDLDIMVRDGLSSSPSGVGKMGRDVYSFMHKLIQGRLNQNINPLYNNKKTPIPNVNSYWGNAIDNARGIAETARQNQIKNQVDAARSKQIREIAEKAKLKAHEEQLRNRR